MRHAVRGVERRGLDRLEDQPRARRDEAIEALEILPVAVVVEAHRERVDAQAGDRLPVRRRARSGPARRARRRRHGRDCRRRSPTGGTRRPSRVAGCANGTSVVVASAAEVAGVAQVVRVLPRELRAGEQRVAHGARRERAGDVGLVERVRAARRVVVALQVHLRAAWSRPRREDVLVELVVVDDARAIAQRDAAAELRGRRPIAPASTLAREWLTSGSPKKVCDRRRGGHAAERRDAAVHVAIVAEVLVVEAERSCRTGEDRRASE